MSLEDVTLIESPLERPGLVHLQRSPSNESTNSCKSMADSISSDCDGLEVNISAARFASSELLEPLSPRHHQLASYDSTSSATWSLSSSTKRHPLHLHPHHNTSSTSPLLDTTNDSEIDLDPSDDEDCEMIATYPPLHARSDAQYSSHTRESSNQSSTHSSNHSHQSSHAPNPPSQTQSLFNNHTRESSRDSASTHHSYSNDLSYSLSSSPGDSPRSTASSLDFIASTISIPPSHPSSLHSNATSPHAQPSSSTTQTNATQSTNAPNNGRPASFGPMKIHRRQKSGKRVKPPPFCSELLHAVRSRMQERFQAHDAQSSISSASSSVSPSSSPSNSSESDSPPLIPTPSSNSPTSSEHSTLKLHQNEFDLTAVPALPIEVWVNVFAHLPSYALMELQMVCHQWSNYCWETVKTLDLTGKSESRYPPTAWLRILPRLSSLTSLTLSSAIPTDTAMTLLGNNANLESLMLHCHANETTTVAFMSIAVEGKMPKLTRLGLWMPCQIKASALQPLIPHLSSLQYFKAETLRQSFCERAFSSLDAMVSLRVLDLSWCKRLSPGIFDRVAKLYHLETLILDMCGCDVTMSGISHLRVLPRLSELSLKWCDHLTDAMLPTLGSFPALLRLDVSFCRHLTAAGIARWLPHIVVARAAPHLG